MSFPITLEQIPLDLSVISRDLAETQRQYIEPAIKRLTEIRDWLFDTSLINLINIPARRFCIGHIRMAIKEAQEISAALGTLDVMLAHASDAAKLIKPLCGECRIRPISSEQCTGCHKPLCAHCRSRSEICSDCALKLVQRMGAGAIS